MAGRFIADSQKELQSEAAPLVLIPPTVVLLRFPVDDGIQIAQLLSCRSEENRGADLWSTSNRIQENFLFLLRCLRFALTDGSRSDHMRCTGVPKALVSPDIKLRMQAVAHRELLTETAWLKRMFFP